MLRIRTFDEIQTRMSDRKKNSRLSHTFESGDSKLHPTASCLMEPLNLHTSINRTLNPLHHVKASSDFLTTERRIVMDVLQMLSQPSI